VPYYPFTKDDLVFNVLKTNPKVEFYIYQAANGLGGGVYYNSRPHLTGAFTGSVPNTTPNTEGGAGFLSLYEMNVDRNDQADGTGLIKSFLEKGGTYTTFKSVSQKAFAEEEYGQTINYHYPLTASIHRQQLAVGSSEHSMTGSALKSTLNHYNIISPHYSYEYERGQGSTVVRWNKDQQDINLISIPSIFYGSSIKRGTVELNFYISGTVAAQLRDINKNGELIQVSGTANNLGTNYGSGSVAGVVLYNEGFVLLTGSWDISAHVEPYTGAGNVNPKWLYFGVGANEGVGSGYNIPSSSFGIKFSGSNEIPVVTMFAHARSGMVNHSNNPSYIQHGQQSQPVSSSHGYSEVSNLQIKNTNTGSFSDITSSFKKQTFISKIGIFDEDKNLLGFAKLATPIKKTEERDLTFKLKLDI
jgi:hypothetical protein